LLLLLLLLCYYFILQVSEARWEATLRAEAQWCATVAGHRNIARALGHTRIGGGFGLVMELAHSDLQALVSRGCGQRPLLYLHACMRG
jgi:hypothetical protein